ncbi:threonine ammonia-lyase, biosynthetic [Taylorella asinigenitalis]|uniref:L-threonine dehydratase n=1 Tax=Taylorella asinigenitalis (strain MCE3) TaxID=1008459 RepID=G4QDL8_TAYAM|nr:threonine ammonia-lyase, biosynthetic [Taylorella asinigenitalis]AEP36035.1 Threonine dehydratase biosynthetic [Taylorella asinigenitalis MCE3]
MLNDYLKLILTSKVYEAAEETPLDFAPILSARINNNIYFKREDSQDVFSFKIRGAYNKMAHLTPKELERGVITSSAGNHAQGVALSARKLGCKAIICMPVSTPAVKVNAVRRLGAEVVLHGESYTETQTHAKKLCKEQNLTFIHPFDDPYVIAGQGTIAMEIMRQTTPDIEAIFCPIGGGGLISGIAIYIKALYPHIKVIGVQTEDSAAMKLSIEADKRVTLSDVGLFSDGTAVKQVGSHTYEICKNYVDDYVCVNTDEICSAIRDVFLDTRNVVEPAGALSVAGAKKYAYEKGLKGTNLVAVTTGANMNFDLLRFVAERASVGDYTEALFSVTMPEKKGSFKKLCAAIGNRQVTEFNYRISDKQQAHVFIGIQTTDQEGIRKLHAQLDKEFYDVRDLSNDDLAKTHIRHMVGGKSPLAENELLYRFEFPERPGALMNFLLALNPEWNISLFHYRNTGGDFGHVLCGIQVPPDSKKAFKEVLKNLGYRYVNETDNPAYKMFL